VFVCVRESMCVCAREREGDDDLHTLKGTEGDFVCERERERVCVRANAKMAWGSGRCSLTCNRIVFSK
jgi:hypothetical protein